MPGSFGENHCDHLVNQGFLVFEVPVERSGLNFQLAAEKSKGQLLQANFIQELQSCTGQNVAIYLHESRL